MKNLISKKVLYGIAAAVGVTILAFMIVSFVKYASYKEIISGTLSEIDDGIYVQTYNVYSNVPANNTTVAVICTGTQMLTVQGHINISFTDETPSYSYTRTNIVNGDTLNVYVPKGTVQMLGGVNSLR